MFSKTFQGRKTQIAFTHSSFFSECPLCADQVKKTRLSPSSYRVCFLDGGEGGKCSSSSIAKNMQSPTEVNADKMAVVL